MAGDVKRPLEGKVAVVAGATRHAGRGVAIELGIAGATVYCTGRSTRSNRSDRTQPGSIEETAAMVEAHGGKAIWAKVDHSDIDAVQALVDRVMAEQGKIDLLVNAVSGNASNDPFLQSDLAENLERVFQAGRAHLVTAHVVGKKMVAAGSGLMVSISDREWDQFYAIEKSIINRLSLSVAEELRPFGVGIVSLLPGAFFHCFDVMTLEEHQAAVALNPNVLKCHTPRLIGRAVVALATDREVLAKSGQLLPILNSIGEYGFTDIDDRQSGEMW